MPVLFLYDTSMLPPLDHVASSGAWGPGQYGMKAKVDSQIGCLGQVMPVTEIRVQQKERYRARQLRLGFEHLGLEDL